MLPPAIVDYLQNRRRQHLSSLMELLRFPSIANVQASPDPCVQCAQWLVEYISRLGLRAELLTPASVGQAPRQAKPNILAAAHVRDDAPTLLIYGHYDVQPPDPLELWKSDPFSPQVRDGFLYARGASDDKGQLFAHLMALEAWQHAGGGLPVNVKLLIEGEEEIASPTLEKFMAGHIEQLKADAAVISDSEFFAPGIPSLTTSLRGLAYVEVTFRGPDTDVHSGLHGGAVTNPVNALAALVGALHDAQGRITIDGFYDDVLPLEEAQRRTWAKLPFDEARYAASLGVEALGGGEKGYSALERRWARPTLDCNGIVAGYTGRGSKTIIPSQALVKISMRLVANQDPGKVIEGFKRFVAGHTPPGIRSEVKVSGGARPVMLRVDSPSMTAAAEALQEAFGAQTAFIRCGASVPVTEYIQRLLGLDAVLMGWGLPDDGPHSPNEHFALEQLWRGSQAAAAFLGNLGRLGGAVRGKSSRPQ